MKQEYNRVLARWKKAGSIETTLTEKSLPELHKISLRLAELLDVIQIYSEDEALKGFKEYFMEVS